MDSTKDQLTDAEKQIARKAYERVFGWSGAAFNLDPVFAAVSAVLASRAPHDVEKAAEAAYTRFMVVAFHGRPLEPQEQWQAIPTARRNDWMDAVEAAAPFLQEREGAQPEPPDIPLRMDKLQEMNAQPTAEQPVDGELVEEMDQAHFRLATGSPYTRIQTNIDGMTAALRVAADRLLCPVNEEDRKAWLQTPLTSSPALTMRSELDANVIFANRYARLAAKKTVEERVTVVGAVVYLDGKEYAAFKGHDSHEPAMRYATGLRAEITTLRESEGAK